jgi:hypothetical protein
MPPSLTLAVSRGARGFVTSNRLSSPVPQHETNRERSSTLSAMSVTSGGTAPNGLSRSGSWSGSAGWAGIVMTFSAATRPSSPRFHSHTEAERSWVFVTTPTKP